MFSFAVTNAANKNNEVYIFHRTGEKLCIFKDVTFRPYFYELDPTGIYRTIDNKKVKKVLCKNTWNVKQHSDSEAYESDVPLYRRFIIDKLGPFLPVKIKYSFVDIEVLCHALPSFQFPDSPISCISASNNYTGEIKTWYLADYARNDTTDEIQHNEKKLLNDFVAWINEQKFDFIAAWNMLNFDWRYLSARYEKVFSTKLADILSPILCNRIIGSKDPIYLPAGVGIVDYLDWYKKIYKGKASYSLDNIAQEDLGDESFGKADFSKLSEDLKRKNINDVRRMMRLEEKFHVVDYYNALRMMSRSQWEDLTWNSKMLDTMVLTEAKQRNLVLPSKKYDSEFEETFEGAYRRCNIEDEYGNITERLTGLYKDLWKVDLGSAYPRSIIDFCLDIQNIKENEGILIRNTKFYQNSNSLLPSMARKLINKKDDLKKQLKTIDPESQEGKDLQIKYDAQKAVVNSLFGVCGLKVFRLFDIRIASAITFLIRDLLHYVENKVQELGMKVIYLDTDSLFLQAKENPTDILNNLIKRWAKEKYGKDNIGIEFDLEGKFQKLLIVSLCHYVGILEKMNGKTKKEIKGVEIKRADSSKFMKKFQTELIDRIMNEETKQQIEKFIEEQKILIRTLSLSEVGFPCKLTGKTDYASPPIFLRGNEYTQELNPKWNKVAGDAFYYIPVEPFGTSIRKSSRIKNGERQFSEKEVKKDILCFDEEQFEHIKSVDWDKVIKKSIETKIENIYEAMGWVESKIKKERKK